MTEYVLVVALVSLLAGGVTSRVANQIRLRFGEISGALAGQRVAGAVGRSHGADLKAMTPASLKQIRFED
jgi:Flp pilus assembly pilin Flp